MKGSAVLCRIYLGYVPTPLNHILSLGAGTVGGELIVRGTLLFSSHYVII